MNPAQPDPSKPTIYLDYQATTPCDERVVEKMVPYFGVKYGNPHSRNHKYGWEAEEATERARKQIGDAVNAPAKSIIFTSGATEANNLALKGCAMYMRAQYGKNHLITTNTEHKCVLESMKALEKQGFAVTYVQVNREGLIAVKDIEERITERTCLVSVAMVHNEIGVVQPIEEIGEVCERYGVYLHTDAAQALGKVAVDVEKMKIDLMSISAHKMYGPKGVGALYVRNRALGNKRRVRLHAMQSGGGQERGFRSGTLPTPLCVGMGEAADIAERERSTECARIQKYFDYFVNHMEESLDHVYLNGSRACRVPHNVNMSFRFVEGESVMVSVPDLAFSSGSACTSASLEPSYVLKALGVNEELAHTSLRFGFGRYTQEADVKYAAQKIIEAVKDLRERSPLYEMYLEGVDLAAIKWDSH